ncbi:MAG: tRNA lysidine(34) synthetase TilS [Sphingomonadales bacterium]|nr:tRNA lysidine(34) synthetase TilS [Sphingomonadales bacterium]MDE2168207.1 tRNA lysidine(34) synthetase TilS [Sphingomonadales bacterium]
MDPALIGRFAQDLARIWPEADQGQRRGAGQARLALAVSGGPDSVALLLLAHQALPGRVMAATVDHRLRPEAAEEAAHVARICADLGVPHATLPVDVADGNVQAQAREARYAALAGWMEREGLAALATAHHADDQAETLVMRLNRGSGVAGLAGVRERALVPTTRWPLLRPLLGWRRAELAAIAAPCAPVQDPSNENTAFDRVRIRQALAQSDWVDVLAWAQAAAHLAEADAALDWAAAREWAESVTRDAMGITYRPQAPRGVALRVVSRIVEELDGAARGGAIARLFDTLVARQPGSIGNLVVRPMPSGWSFAKAPKRRV